MATRVDSQQLLTEATQFQQTMVQIELNIGQMEPQDQLLTIEQVALQQQVALKELQKKADDIFKQHDFDPTSGDIIESFSQSDAIIDKLCHNHEFLMKFKLLHEDVQQVLQMPPFQKAQKLPALSTRVIQLTTEHKDLYQKNKDALAQFNTMFTMASQINTTNAPVYVAQQPVYSSQQPLASTRRSDAPTPTPRNQLIAQQNNEYDQSLAQDQFKDLETEFKGLTLTFSNDPAQDFEKAIAYYTKLKTFSLSKPIFPNADSKIGVILKEAENLLGMTLQAQKNKESQQAPSTSGSQDNKAMFALKDAIQQALDIIALPNGDVSQINTIIQPAFSKLSSQQKQTLFTELEKVLLETKKIQKALAKPLLGQPFNIWPGNWETKKVALGRILPTSQPTQAATNVASKALEMQQRMQKAINAQPAVSTQQTTARGPSRQPSQSAPPQVSVDNVDDIPTEDQFPKTPLLKGIEVLRSIFPLIKEDAQMSQLQDACEKLFLLEAEGTKCAFNGNKESIIADRPYYHLYFIHKNEEPSKLKDDLAYGSKSWSGEIAGATNNERERSLIRASVEIALQGLDDAINFVDGESFVRFLDVLNTYELNKKDHAKGCKFVSHMLFGAFYHLHVKARESNTSLIDPNSPQFGGDFGRKGFSHQMIGGVDPEVMLEAIKQVQGELKAAWKVQ